jgi:hypothetical protein
MADEPAAPSVVEDTPTPAAPATPDTPINSDSPAVPDGYIEDSRYKELQAEFTRRNELLADIEGRNGPEKQAAALAEHARIELEDDSEPVEDDEFDLPPDPLDEIQAIKQELAQRDEAAQAAEFDRLEAEYVEKTVEALEEKENLKLSDAEYDAVVNHALSNRDQHDGKPDLEGGFAKLKAIQEAAQKRYLDSKNEAVLAPIGATGEPKIDLKDKDARQKLGIEVFEAAERSKQT